MALIPRVLLAAAVVGLAAAQANADELAASAPASPGTPAKAKVTKAAKAPKPAARETDGLGGVKFSNPYGPPEGTTATKAPDFPGAARSAPNEPQGDVSFTYKWHAANGWIDPYDAVRHSAPPEGYGDSFMGGLKLGF